MKVGFAASDESQVGNLLGTNSKFNIVHVSVYLRRIKNLSYVALEEIQISINFLEKNWAGRIFKYLVYEFTAH